MEKGNQYLYSSASNYSFGKGLTDIEIADNPVIDVWGRNEFWKSNNDEEEDF
ncbi:hypothetical protein KSK37_08125 [Kaistella sp. DKR-2]|nr:hypothetical protein [Kaistella soli]